MLKDVCYYIEELTGVVVTSEKSRLEFTGMTDDVRMVILRNIECKYNVVARPCDTAVMYKVGTVGAVIDLIERMRG